MHCDVYKFPKMSDWYVYIARPDYPNDTDEIKDWLAVLPSDLRARLGFSVFVMHLDLAQKDKLALADINVVKDKLKTQGYYVQAPPSEVLTRQALNKAKGLQDKALD